MSVSRHYFVLGGTRSGKSSFAEKLTLDLASGSANLADSSTDRADGLPSSCVYIATAEVLDDEMQRRVARHQQGRTAQWETIEVPIDLPKTLLELSALDKPILVDCLTLWLTNLMMKNRDIEQAGHDIEQAGNELITVLSQMRGSVVFVSDEVGQGIVPDNKMARIFRDHAGFFHQKIAKAVDEVYFITAGLPLKLKG